MPPPGTVGPAALACLCACLLASVACMTADEVTRAAEPDAGARGLLQDAGEEPPELQCGARTLYTYVVSLSTEQGSHLCGGALIRRSWVLTAARCVDVSFSQMAELRPRVNIAGRTPGTAVQTLRTIATYVPPQWDGNPRSGYDLALLKLEKPACMKPISIAPAGFNMTADEALLYLGWGRFGNTGAFSDVLQAGDMAYLPNKDCREALVQNKVTRQMLCARGVTTEGLCSGDEGSPLVYAPREALETTRHPFRLVGVGSFADVACTEPNSISLFSNVPRLSNWIKRTIREDKERMKGRR